MKNLIDLPIELILKIFNYLEYDDLIVLNNLNEEWSDLVKYFVKLKILVIDEDDEFSYESSYYDHLYLIGRSSRTFELNSDLHFFIRKLVLFYPLFIFDLVDFDNLIDLKIYLDLKLNQNPGQLSLRLKNLKNLRFYQYKDINLKICLNTPKLIKLDVEYSDLFEIDYPSEIKYLRVRYFNEVINQMNNLEELILIELEIDKIGDLFKRLERLKKFNFFYCYQNLTSIDQFIQSISLLNPNLKISYKDIELNSDLNLMKLNLLFNTHLSNLKQGYLQIQTTDLIPTEFIEKLTNLGHLVIIGQITDQEKWIKVLSLPKLTYIEIYSLVDQELLNLIPKYCKFLECLIINRVENVEWLLQLKYLKYLETLHQFDFEIFKKFVNNNFAYLKIFKFSTEPEKYYEIKIRNDHVQCLFDVEDPMIRYFPSSCSSKRIIKVYSKSLFLKKIASSTRWDLFWNLLELN